MLRVPYRSSQSILHAFVVERLYFANSVVAAGFSWTPHRLCSAIRAKASNLSIAKPEDALKINKCDETFVLASYVSSM